MFGPPSDVPGKCNARLYIGDDYGDNSSTMRCQLPPDHEGKHYETWRDGECEIRWTGAQFRCYFESDDLYHGALTKADLNPTAEDWADYNNISPLAQLYSALDMLEFCCRNQDKFDTAGLIYPPPTFEISI